MALTSHGGPQACEMLRLPHFLDRSQIAVKLSASFTNYTLTPGRFLVLISVRG
jgi:hypothetical protein